MRKLTIEKLSETKEIDGAKRWIEEKGEFVQVSYQEDIRHVAIFEINHGFARGGHYHEYKDETFYIVRGRIRALFSDIDSEEREEHILLKGDKVHIEPRLAHIFYGIDDALVVEYSSRYYDKSDGFRYEFEG